mmetsp:Transcript_19103/g.53200  ORF Transcript_19103/g.53200 Transcript_19103/m.53200 type:complete len:220 (+) Transcript_19103:145-804(+)
MREPPMTRKTLKPIATTTMVMLVLATPPPMTATPGPWLAAPWLPTQTRREASLPRLLLPPSPPSSANPSCASSSNPSSKSRRRPPKRLGLSTSLPDPERTTRFASNREWQYCQARPRVPPRKIPDTSAMTRRRMIMTTTRQSTRRTARTATTSLSPAAKRRIRGRVRRLRGQLRKRQLRRPPRVGRNGPIRTFCTTDWKPNNCADTPGLCPISSVKCAS